MNCSILICLEGLQKKEKSELSNVMKYSYRYEGDIICRKGDIAETYYLIKSGDVVCSLNGTFVTSLCAGQAFGEQALYYMAERQCDVIVESENIELLELTRSDMQSKDPTFLTLTLDRKA